MRTLCFGFLFLTGGLAAFAQAPAGPGSPPNPTSPVVHADRRVTFKIHAADAAKVTLVDGVMMEATGGPKELTKGDDGIWTLTVGPLQSGIYDYGFSIDGGPRMPDPANRNLIRRTWGFTSFVDVPGAF